MLMGHHKEYPLPRGISLKNLYSWRQHEQVNKVRDTYATHSTAHHLCQEGVNVVCKMTALWLLNYVLQTISVAVLYIVGFTGPTFVLGAVTLYQLFRYTPLWPFVILYLSWVFLIDWKTPERGGRDLLRNFARRLAIFKHMKDYYPITLVKTSELDPQKNYIFGYHPHGFFTEGASIGFGTDACGFGEKFPGIIPHLAVHSGKNFFSSSLAFLVIVVSLYVTQGRERGLSPRVAWHTERGQNWTIVIAVPDMKQNLFEEQPFSPFALCDFCQIPL